MPTLPSFFKSPNLPKMILNNFSLYWHFADVSHKNVGQRKRQLNGSVAKHAKSRSINFRFKQKHNIDKSELFLKYLIFPTVQELNMYEYINIPRLKQTWGEYFGDGVKKSKHQNPSTTESKTKLYFIKWQPIFVDMELMQV